MSEEFIARLRGEVAALRAARQDYDAGHQAVADRAAEYFTEAADHLERAERVVEGVRAILRDEQNDEQSDLSYDHLSSQRYNALNRIRSAFAAYDTTRADKSRTTLRREAAQRGEDVPEFHADKGREQFTTCRGCGATALLPDAPELCSSCKQNQHIYKPEEEKE